MLNVISTFAPVMISEFSDDSLSEFLADSGSEYEPESDTGSESEIEMENRVQDNHNRSWEKGKRPEKDATKPKRRHKTSSGDDHRLTKDPSSSNTEHHGKGVKRIADDVKPETSSKKINVPDDKKTSKKLSKPFGKLLDNVIFVLSGFQNPLRSEIRQKGLAMGAKYKSDWDSSCTHLICAFTNTPKFNQVKGHGKIVKKDWFEQCYSRRMRLPWRRYALDKRDLSEPVSEDEVFEETSPPSAPLVDSRRRLHSDSEEDTDQEIERVRVKQQGKQKKHTDSECSDKEFQPRIREEETAISVYDMDTDVEDSEETPKESREAMDHLSDIFKSLIFSLSEKLAKDDKSKLHRYIIAHKGSLTSTTEDNVDIVISEDREEAEKLKEQFPDLTVVSPEWVWRSHDEDKLLPTSPYEIS